MAAHHRRKKTMALAIMASKDTASNSFWSDGIANEEKPPVPMKKMLGNGDSTVSKSASRGQSTDTTARNLSPSFHDTSMDELASRLLDDSNLSQFQSHPGRRFSQQSIVNALHLSDSSRVHKDLPQLPQLLFNNDDAWALQFRPAEFAEGSTNALEFLGDEPYGHLSVRESFKNQRKSHAPMIPPKSSRRPSVREAHHSQASSKSTEATRPKIQLEQNSVKKHSVSAPIPVSSSPSTLPKASLTISSPLPIAHSGSYDSQSAENETDINAKIEAMLAATDALKGKKESRLEHASKIFRSNPLFSKVRFAFRSHRNEYRKKHHDPADEHLLDDKLNETPELDEEDSSSPKISAVEGCVNEGLNLNKPKVRALTGNGNVVRKPLPDDGRSLRSRKSSDDPFAMQGSRSDYLDKYPPLIPTSASCSSPSPPPISTPSPTSGRSPPVLPRISTFNSSLGAEFSPLCSEAIEEYLANPDDRSTPETRRWKLQPSIGEDGSRGRLVLVSATTPSLLDRRETRTYTTAIKSNYHETHMDTATRKPNYLRDARSEPIANTLNLYDSEPGVRRKKHPSPSKQELEELERSLSGYSTLMIASTSTSFPPLANRSTNTMRSLHHNGSRGMSRASESSTNAPEVPSRIPRRVPMIPKSATFELPIRRLPPATHPDSQLLEDTMDELQWDVETYHVGMQCGR